MHIEGYWRIRGAEEKYPEAIVIFRTRHTSLIYFHKSLRVNSKDGGRSLQEGISRLSGIYVGDEIAGVMRVIWGLRDEVWEAKTKRGPRERRNFLVQGGSLGLGVQGKVAGGWSSTKTRKFADTASWFMHECSHSDNLKYKHMHVRFDMRKPRETCVV